MSHCEVQFADVQASSMQAKSSPISCYASSMTSDLEALATRFRKALGDNMAGSQCNVGRCRVPKELGCVVAHGVGAGWLEKRGGNRVALTDAGSARPRWRGDRIGKARDVREGSIASVSRCPRRVGFTPNNRPGRRTKRGLPLPLASQGQHGAVALQCNYSPPVAHCLVSEIWQVRPPLYCSAPPPLMELAPSYRAVNWAVFTRPGWFWGT